MNLDTLPLSNEQLSEFVFLILLTGFPYDDVAMDTDACEYRGLPVGLDGVDIATLYGGGSKEEANDVAAGDIVTFRDVSVRGEHVSSLPLTTGIHVHISS